MATRSGPRSGTRPTQKPRSDLGARIAAARMEAGLTQRQLADAMNLSQRVIAHWETASVTLRPDQMVALADALGVTTDYLLGRQQAKRDGVKGGMVGKTRRVFEEVSTLPRHQQEKVLDFVAHFIKGFGNNANGKAAPTDG